MSDQVENQNVGFLMTRLFFSDTRFRGITFTVAKHQAQTGSLCGVFDGPISDVNTQNPLRIKCRIPQVGRFVRLTSPDGTVEMCELEVYTKRNAN